MKSVAIGVLLAIVPACAAAGEEPKNQVAEWKAGVASAVITPQTPAADGRICRA